MTPRLPRLARTAVIAALVPMSLLVGTACLLGPDDNAAIGFDAQLIDLAEARDTLFQIVNDDSEPYGPVEISVNRIETSAGAPTSGPQLVLGPTEIPTLNPGDRRTIAATVIVPTGTPDDQYHAFVQAEIPGAGTTATLEIRFTVLDNEVNATVATLTITAPSSSLRQGDATAFSIETFNADGDAVEGARPRWSVIPSEGGFVDLNGRFVGYQPGTVRLVAEAGDGIDSVDVTIIERGLTGTFESVGQGLVTNRFTSDLWVHGSAAYTGTWSLRNTDQGVGAGNTLYAWDVSNPVTPLLTDSVRVDARTVNDVKVGPGGDLAVITHERSDDGANGITLLDLSDPLHPTVITRFTSTLTTGVHNVWVEGDYVYLVVDGISPSSGLRILDIRNPAQPEIVAQFYGGSSFLHDVYVRDGLAFLSHWDAGLIILDVGNGIETGSPTDPVEVSRVRTSGGQTHNAWYWPDNGYVFVGEEDFGTPGIMHVVDVRDLRRPVEVATFRVPGDTPHNFWLDETNAVAYLGWYANGIRAIDVQGDLLGHLEMQGREITNAVYNGGTTQTWAPQLHNGLLYLSDLRSGLVVMRLNN